MSTYEIVWEFTVASERRAAFEAAYRATGAWAALFSRAAGFLDTTLLCDLERPGVYLTIDRWSSEEAFMRFKRAFELEYARLDEECEGLCESERRIGVYARARH